MKIVSWNVNGIRACYKKGFLDWLEKEKPDVLCIQETKSKSEQLPEKLRKAKNYYVYWADAVRPGYSGTALFSLRKPAQVEIGIGIKKYDDEGRTIIADYGDFVLFNSYYPNGRHDLSRVGFKLEYYDAIMKKAKQLVDDGRNVILTGDFNTAHKEIDLARPKENEKNTGFLPEERKKIDELIELGFVDTFRVFTKEGGHYTWWSMRTKARERNVGWRLDYFFVNRSFLPRVKASYMLTDVMGSDHCPIVLELKE